ncbi:MAG: SURF1 family protein [Burkholderiaceae bacterium]
MTAPLRSLRFRVLTAAALAGIALTASLGFWQLSRAGQKIALQQKMEARLQMPPLDGPTLASANASDTLMHRRVVLRGTWLARKTVFLENRQMGGKPGFFVVTPLRLENAGAVVVVQRGWVQRNFTDRVQLPVVVTDAAPVQVEGRIAPPPSKLYEFSRVDQGVIRQNLDMQGYAAEIGVSLLPVSVLQTGAGSDGLQRDWPPVLTGVEKHYGYAFQWFALAALITILYVWFQIVRRVATPR